MAWWGVALAVAVLLFVWPLTLRAALRMQTGGFILEGSASGLFARLQFEARHEQPDGDEWSLELRLLHAIPLRCRFAGASRRFDGLRSGARLLQLVEQGKVGESSALGMYAAAVGRHALRTWRSRKEPEPPLAAAVRSGAAVAARRLTVRALRLRLDLGFGDAAATAGACGVAWSLCGAALGTARSRLRFACRPRVHIGPVYQRPIARLSADGRASIPQGFAFLALSAGAWSWLREKLRVARRKSRPRV